MSKVLFALDIGTRKVKGIVAVAKDDCVEIAAVETAEHASRAMFDGQIHSIDEVAKTVRTIKEKLETRLRAKLSHVGVALAGRNLLTYQGKVIKVFDTETEVTQEMVRDIELEAVDTIIREQKEKLSQHYCVGYNPVYYELDNSRIANLIGHRAQTIATEVIVTFLPRVVLDSMFAVLKKADLEATNITLEPISAINAIIPPELRNLNIVLVDIGAGTADLAVTKDGFVSAFGMVSEAGDEITEAISHLLLADFSTAERIKRMLSTHEEITFEDIWGRSHTVKSDLIRRSVYPAVRKLAAAIAKEALALNGACPAAVVAVGGGSLTPQLIEALSEAFDLSREKIGIRLPQAVKNIRDLTGTLIGPDTITPIGITLMTARSLGLRFVDITVNGKKFRLLDFQQKKDIMGALTLAGVMSEQKRLYARPGLALTVEVDGVLKVVKGSLGSPARILRNNQEVFSLSEKINDNDVIEFREAIDGSEGSMSLKELLGLLPVHIIYNSEVLLVDPVVIMDGKKVPLDAPVQDRAKIQTASLTVKDVLSLKQVPVESLSSRNILVNINATPKILTQSNYSLLKNGHAAELEEEIAQGDVIEFSSTAPLFFRIKDVLEMPEYSGGMVINVDGKDIEIALETVQVYMNGQKVSPEEFLIDGADIKVYYLKDRQVLLSEIFKYIEFDPYKSLGKKLKIMVNDVPAGFTTPLRHGSRVEILFEER